jgi:hypothetical protein
VIAMYVVYIAVCRNLAANQLAGTVPTELGQLTNLRYLYLRGESHNVKEYMIHSSLLQAMC